MAPTRKSGTGKRGRPKKSAAEPTAKRNREPAKRVVKASKAPKTRTRASNAGNFSAPSDQMSASSVPRGRKRKDDADEADEVAAAPTQKAPEYLQLEPKTKRVPQQTIEKWPVMSDAVLDQISIRLRHAKDFVANSRRGPKERDEAFETLNTIVPKLERSLSMTKIPPQAKAHHFNMEHMDSLNEQMRVELDTAGYRKMQLVDQVERATTQLKKDERLVEQAKKNAKAWRKKWDSQEKKQLHPLLQQSEKVTMVDDRPDDIGLRRSTPIDTSMLDTPDSELAPLLEQLRRAHETMQRNMAQLDGINEALRDARVALDDVLFKHASAQQYDAL